MRVCWIVVLVLSLFVGMLHLGNAFGEIAWDSNSVNWDYSTFKIWQLEPTFEIVFDANSNPLMVGRVATHWLKTNSDDCEHIIFYVPLKDKVEYLAILAEE